MHLDLIKLNKLVKYIYLEPINKKHLMKIHIYIIVAFVLITTTLVTLSGCIKDKAPKDAYNKRSIYNIPQDFKDYFYFAPGTYWIYQNQRTQELDSVYIVDRSSRIVHYSNEPIDEEVCFVHYYDSHYGVLFETNTHVSWGRVDTLSRGRYELEIASKSGFPTGGGYFTCIYPLIKGNIAYQSSYSLEIREDNDTMQIQNIIHSGISKLYSKRNILFNNHETNIYYLKNFGIVRKTDLTKNDDWVLIRCNIIK